jgi:hypothetical protein
LSPIEGEGRTFQKIKEKKKFQRIWSEQVSTQGTSYEGFEDLSQEELSGGSAETNRRKENLANLGFEFFCRL